MDTSTSRENLKEPNYQAITWRDVLRAIFVPDDDAEPISSLRMPSINMRQFATLTPTRSLDVSDEDERPTEIVYQEDGIEKGAESSTRRMAILGGGTTISILIAYLGQSAMSNRGDGVLGALFLFIAAVIWLSLLVFEFAPPDGGLLRRGPIVLGQGSARSLSLPTDTRLNIRIMTAVVSVILSILTYIATARNTFTGIGVILWVLSIIGWLLTFSDRDPATLVSDSMSWLRELPGRMHWPSTRTVLLSVLFLLIFGVAVFYRIYRLDAVPNEMTSDHVEKLLDTYDVTQGKYSVFFTRNGGREAFQFYFLAVLSKLAGTGMSFLTLKLGTVIEGLAIFPFMVILARELLDRETGFYATALLAISWWDIMLSRLALRIVLTPLVFTFLLIVLIRGIRTGERRPWVWAGIWLGVGVYSYQALRIAPLVAVAAAAVSLTGPLIRWLRHRNADEDTTARLRARFQSTFLRQSLNLVVSGVIALAIFVPMLRVWHDYPEHLWNRVINRTTSNEVSIEDPPAEIFVANYIDALRMFNLKGDSSWFSAIPDAPVLDVITAILFVLGFCAWLVRLWLRRDPVDAFTLAAALIMLLPSALAIAFPVENPSTTRASGTLPVVFILAAWPLTLIRQRWTQVLGAIPGRVLSGALIVVLLATAAFSNFNLYFTRLAYAYSSSAQNPGEVAAAVRAEIGPDAALDGVWLQGWPFWHDFRAIGIEAGDITFNNAIVDVPTLVSYLDGFPGEFLVRPLIFIVHPLDEEALAVLQERFPEGQSHTYISGLEGKSFILYIVPED